ncbi:hypothetical protein TNCV_4558361 [Trichonephila clavipes]|nr:hypothetical protein TNCV_4558361 [Trichonephila clavipes]
MVDIDILMEIWKNRVKKIDFVLKWLSRVGSEVGPTKGFCEGYTRNRWRDGQVCPDVEKELWRLVPDGSGVFWRGTSVSRCGQQTMAPWARRLGKESGRENDQRRRTRKSGERTDGRRRRDGKDGRERERERRRKERKRGSGRVRVKPALNGKRAESGIGVKKTMNAGGVENGI